MRTLMSLGAFLRQDMSTEEEEGAAVEAAAVAEAAAPAEAVASVRTRRELRRAALISWKLEVVVFKPA